MRLPLPSLVSGSSASSNSATDIAGDIQNSTWIQIKRPDKGLDALECVFSHLIAYFPVPTCFFGDVEILPCSSSSVPSSSGRYYEQGQDSGAWQYQDPGV
ncbi:hypothetical protein KC351_g54 [Hortaea werneckii]|nr:hypothetical protein KC351_g54 [Hortaea werneckii]